MPLTAPTYVTREDVKAALDVAETARSNDRIDRAITSATESVDATLRRTFTPWVGTRHFRWPDRQSPTAWRLWLGRDEVVAVTALVSGGATISTGDLFLEPANYGPPFTHIETDISSAAAFATGDTSQHAIAITGTFGYRVDEEEVGVLAGTLGATTSATASVTWSTARIGVGTLLRIGDERVTVVERTMVDSTQNLLTSITASAAVTSLSVTDGSAFALEQILLVGAERMRIVDIAGNTLIVKRAFDGSVLAAHTNGDDIYTLTGVQLARAQCGSAIATHDTDAVIYRHAYPSLVRDLALAYALNQLLQESSGYARVAGSGDNQREMTGRGIASIENDAIELHGRQLLMGAV